MRPLSAAISKAEPQAGGISPGFLRQLRSNTIVEKCLFLEAKSGAVVRRQFASKNGSAPASRRTCTTRSASRYAALCKGVNLRLSCALTVAPEDMRNSTSDSCPRREAVANGVTPDDSRGGYQYLWYRGFQSIGVHLVLQPNE